jgi:two-component sensor histidine kinase
VPRALEGIRVLEVGHLVGAAYATKLLADLGADVVKIEPPGIGDAARRRGPFPHGEAHPERSGLFLYLNANKRGITLDLTRPAGRAAFDRLVADADLLVHNVHPMDMAAHGLDYDRLSALNPRLVMTSIAPFGLTGPLAHYRATDLVLWNAGGIATLNGDPAHPELPPLKAFGDQAGFQAGVHAAIPSLAALVAGARELADTALTEVRQLSHVLRPQMLDDLGLEPTLRWLVRTFQKRTGIAVDLVLEGAEGRADADVETLVYRIVQEALTNVARHSSAARATVRLGRDPERLRVAIEDSGSGFTPEPLLSTGDDDRGFGLRAMRDRVEFVSGHFSIRSAPGQGTVVEAEVPLSGPDRGRP